MTKFSIEDNFFIIDSNNLNDIKTRLYGFGISEDSNHMKDKLTLNGIGCYLYIYCDEQQITISQDYIGCYGLYLFQDKDYFALSNSFIYLVDYIKTKYKITLNKDYANYLLVSDLCAEIYKDTLVNEIKTLSRNSIILIDKQTKKLKIDYIDYKENTVDFGSDEYFAILDNWYYRWTNIVKNLQANNENISIDLSGGMDSRCILSLLLSSGVDLTTIEVNSIEDKLHTHAEDFEIASQIANDYNFVLNKRLNIEKESFSLKDIINLSFYTKLGFHHQMYWKKNKYIVPKYQFVGQGGELIRDYWHFANISKFIKGKQWEASKYSKEARLDISKSIERILNKSSDLIKDNYLGSQCEDENFGAKFYRETRCRNHFGKAMLESYLSNTIIFAPLLDPELNKLKLNSNDCLDRNFLLSLIFTRYQANLLNYKFDSKRFIDKETIEFAKKMNELYPFNKNNNTLTNYNIIKSSDLYPQARQEYIAPKDEESLSDFLINVFHSDSVKTLFTIYFPQSILDVIDNDVKNRKYHPLTLAYSVLGITKIINDVLISESLHLETDFDVFKNFSIKLEDKKFYLCNAVQKDNIIQQKDNIIKVKNLTIKRLQHSWSYKIGHLVIFPFSVSLKVFRLIRDYRLLKKSDLFDAEYYLSNNEDVRKAKKNPIIHYLRFGWKEHRNPSSKFDSKAYLTQRPDVKVAGVCPLVHYLKFGKKE